MHDLLTCAVPGILALSLCHPQFGIELTPPDDAFARRAALLRTNPPNGTAAPLKEQEARFVASSTAAQPLARARASGGECASERVFGWKGSGIRDSGCDLQLT